METIFHIHIFLVSNIAYLYFSRHLTVLAQTKHQYSEMVIESCKIFRTFSIT